MNFHVLTLFPEMIANGLHTSITGRALEKGTISLDLVNIRDYTTNKHKKVDDYPYGGGAGMLMQAQPVYDAFLSVTKNLRTRMRPRVIYLAPQGKPFISKWHGSLPAKRIWLFCAVIMKESTSVFLIRL